MKPLTGAAWTAGAVAAGAAVAGAATVAGAAVVAAHRVRNRPRLRGGVALVTGGSRGLGLLIARELASRGFRLAICARDEAELGKAWHELSALGTEVFAQPCDVADRSQVDRLVRAVAERFGGLDLLVNNAGVITVAPLPALEVEDFARAQDVMFWGPLYSTLAALPYLRDSGHGRIVNITSLGGKVSVPHLLPYNCAKFAAVGLSEGLRAELAGTGIGVTTVVPGLMRTGSHLHARFKGKAGKEYAWFAVAASLPGLSMDAERAARRIVVGALAGRSELVLTPAAKLAVRAQALFPGTTGWLLGAANRLLPASDPAGSGSVPGKVAAEQLDSGLVEQLTVLGRSAARRFQQ